jgi:hypothetical protein
MAKERRLIAPSALAATLLCTAATAFATPLRSFVHARRPVVCDRPIEDFSSSRVGHFPTGWRTRDPDEMPRAQARHLYQVESVEGRHVLHARYAAEAITIGRKVANWNLDEYPILQWRWKAVTLPRGGNERHSRTNDSAAGVYVIWDVGFPFRVEGIKYAWSTTIDVGGRYSKRLAHDQLLVVESGTQRAGTWVTVRVDVRAHRKKFFDEDAAEPPDGIAVLTDADATASSASAYYADFALCRLGP